MDTNLETGFDANREFKDTVFSLLFNDIEVLIPLYNAIFGTNYGPDTEVDIKTIRKKVSKSILNDLAFILDNRLIILVEHQSTIDENMPYRMLQYIVETYKRLHELEDDYRRNRFPLQRPKFIVLYNGTDPMPEDEQILRLSDMFASYGPLDEAGPSDLELTVKMYNVNKGHNEKMLKRCATLHEYAIFIDKVREYQKTTPDLGMAVKRAIEDCIDHNVLKKFLSLNKGEVINMMTSEWNMDIAVKVAQEEGMERGMERGEKKKALEIAKNLRARGNDVNTVAEITGLSVDDILRL